MTFFEQWRIFKKNPPACILNPKLAYIIPDDGECAIFVTKEDDVFIIGRDQAFLGEKDEQKPNEPRKIDALCQQKIKSFSFSDYDDHYYYKDRVFAALSEDGKLFVWEEDQRMEPWVSDPTVTIKTPERIELGKIKVTQVAFSRYLMLVLTHEGKVIIYSRSGELETLEFTGHCKVVAIACSLTSSFFLFEDGHLYLYFNHESIMKLAENVKQVAGYKHTLILEDSGDIFSFGSNYYGQLGRFYGYPVYGPTLLTHEFGKASQIAAHQNRSAAEFDDGTVRAWGDTISIEEIQKRNSCWVERTSIDQAFAPCSMWRTVQAPITVAEKMNLKLDERNTADVCFRAGDKQIWAHKQVLKKSSRYFDAMFQSHWTEHDKTELSVELFDYVTFYAFLKYLYTEELMPNINWECLMILADYYGNDKLQRICSKSEQEIIECECETCKRRVHLRIAECVLITRRVSS